MSDLFWPTDERMAKLSPFFRKSHGRPRVDDRRVLSGIIFYLSQWVTMTRCALGYRPPAPESIVPMDQRPTMH